MLDPNSIQRIELAGVLMDLAAPLGKAQALELVFPTIAQLLEGGEENNNVRLLMIGKLNAFIDVVRISDANLNPNPNPNQERGGGRG